MLLTLFSPVAVLLLFTSVATGRPHVLRDVLQLRILPLGDSITFGWNGTAGTDGYRLELAARLDEAQAQYLIVGTQRSGNMADNYNEGHPGYTISQIDDVMDPALEERPNVVLLHAGTNDLNNAPDAEESYDQAPDRLSSLIDNVLGTCPDAVVLVAQIINAANADTESRIKTFNEAVPRVVQSKQQAGNKVTVVDQSVVQASELIDALHPTMAGYAHMGDVWFDGIVAAANANLISAPVDPSQG